MLSDFGIKQQVQERANTFRVFHTAYIGDGQAGRQVYGMDLGPVSSATFFVLIKATGLTTSDDPVISWPTMGSSTNAVPAATVISPSTAPATGIITRYDPGGFTLSASPLVNGGSRYNLLALYGSPSEIAMGTYVGNSTAGREVAMPFAPECVFIRRRGLTTASVVFRTTSMSGATPCAVLGLGSANTGGVITDMSSTGITLGASMHTNVSGVIYDYLIFKKNVDCAFSGMYIGDGVSGRTITTGWKPTAVLVKPNSTAEALLRGEAHQSVACSVLENSTADATQRIQSFSDTGFQLGSSVNINQSGTTYHYIAFRNP